MDSKIELLRQKIDLVDSDIQTLLEKRWEISQQIAQIKEELEIDIYSPDRETEIFLKIMARQDGSNLQNSMLEVYKQILKESKKISQENRSKRLSTFFGSSTEQ